jgi:hypothetical protein
MTPSHGWKAGAGGSAEGAAGGVDEGARDPAGLVGGEEGDDVGDVTGLADPVEGRQLGHRLDGLGVVEEGAAVVGDARRHAVDRDAARGEDPGQVEGELLDRALGHGVGQLVGDGGAGDARGDVHDAPAAGHLPDRALHDEVRRLGVHGEVAVELLGGEVLRRGARRGDGRVVDQDVEAGVAGALLQAAFEAEEEFVHVAGDAEFGADGEGAAAFLLDEFNGLFGRRLVGRVVHRDQRALAGEPDRRRPADAAAGTGHEGGLVGEPVHG